MSPTARTLRELRRRGYIAEVVERRVRSFITRDLFDWIDIVAVKPGLNPILGVQTTANWNNGQARLRKARRNKALMAWLHAGGELALFVWVRRKLKLDRGWSKRYHYVLDERGIAPADLRERKR